MFLCLSDTPELPSSPAHTTTDTTQVLWLLTSLGFVRISCHCFSVNATHEFLFCFATTALFACGMGVIRKDYETMNCCS